MENILKLSDKNKVKAKKKKYRKYYSVLKLRIKALNDKAEAIKWAFYLSSIGYEDEYNTNYMYRAQSLEV